jgi:amino acid adenylation domain-containing protein
VRRGGETLPPVAPVSDAEDLIRLGDGGPPDPSAKIAGHRRFEEIARACPDSVAVVSRAGTLTYAELNARAEAYSRRLRSIGVGPEQVVAVCLPRRLDVLVSVLAVLKAGGAYLPLDAAQPLERRRFMLRDAGASVLVTLPGWEAELADSAEVVRPPGPEDDRGPDRDVRAAEPAPDQLAYIIYTSGSTGRPKGVMIEHRSLAAYVHWGVSNFTPEELSSVLMATSFGFDMSIFEFMVPLSVGGKIVLVDSLFEIREWDHEALTLVDTVPSLMDALLARHIELPDTVQTAVFCGEELPFRTSEAVYRQPGIRRVVNTYGPTEDTVFSTFTEVPRGTRPTIGRPFPGTQAYVLDSNLELVPRGKEGELCLGGIGLARGYRRRDDLTRERFVPNPFDDSGLGRLYRTGDIDRWEEGGSLQHLGRIDHQIKLRGVRIEPAEIEAALLRHPGVRQAVVVARDRPHGDRWLVAYLVGDGDLDTQSLRRMLKGLLPRPMIPSVFVTLAEMPLNANGKLDRSRLPEPAVDVAAASPLTETERTLAEIWLELLELERLPGRDDDYFELGGHSLLAFEVFERIEEQLDRDLSPSVLVEAGTIRSLAALIDSGVARSRLVKLHADGTRVPTVYVHSGAGGMLTLRRFAAALGPDQPLYGIQAYVDEDIERGEIDGVAGAATACLSALLDVQPQGPYILTGHSSGGLIAFEMAARLQAAGESVLSVGLLDPAAPHTLRWTGRLAARALELTGLGAEPRRHAAHRAAWVAFRRKLHSRAGAALGNAAGGGESAWARNLRVVERNYEPPSYSGRVVTYSTVDTIRYTGSLTLGWDRYVEGVVEARRVPGDHTSLLTSPAVEVLAATMDADIRAAQRSAEALLPAIRPERAGDPSA